MMATEDSSTKKRKRLTMDDVNISAPIYEPPKSFSVAGLYDPSFVIIEVLNESSPSWTQSLLSPSTYSLHAQPTSEYSSRAGLPSRNKAT